MPYFPISQSHVPEEVFANVLQYIHPGALWLFGRLVSREWRYHIESNIRRYIELYTRSLVGEERVSAATVSCTWIHSRYVPRDPLDVDSLFILVGSHDRVQSLTVFQVLRMTNVDKSRDIVSFSPESNVVPIYGYGLYLLDIENFMFPGFHNRNPLLSPAKLALGTNSVQFGDYDVRYTYRAVDFALELTILEVRISVEKLMRFSGGRVVKRGDWGRLDSLLFDSAQEDVARRRGGKGGEATDRWVDVKPREGERKLGPKRDTLELLERNPEPFRDASGHWISGGMYRSYGR